MMCAREGLRRDPHAIQLEDPCEAEHLGPRDHARWARCAPVGNLGKTGRPAASFAGAPVACCERSEVTMPSKRASVKNEKQYEGLKKRGMSKARAAKIANSPGASAR